MTEQPDKYWDDLGIAWRAIEVDVDALTPRLQSRLRRQSFLIGVALGLGVPMAVGGIVLGAVTVWWGWTGAVWNFVTRGIAVVVIAGLAMTALLSIVSIRGNDARALAEMVDLAIRRASASLAVIRIGLLSCAIAAVLGVIGAVIRTRAGSPPALSPAVDVAVLGLVTVILLAYRQRANATLAKMRYLEHAIASNGTDRR